MPDTNPVEPNDPTTIEIVTEKPYFPENTNPVEPQDTTKIEIVLN